MCGFPIGRAVKQVNRTSWVVVFIPSDRLKLVRRGNSHKTDSDLFIFLPLLYYVCNNCCSSVRTVPSQHKFPMMHVEYMADRHIVMILLSHFARYIYFIREP